MTLAALIWVAIGTATTLHARIHHHPRHAATTTGHDHNPWAISTIITILTWPHTVYTHHRKTRSQP